MVGIEDAVIAMLMPSVDDCRRLGIVTQTQALTYLGRRVRLKRFGVSPGMGGGPGGGFGGGVRKAKPPLEEARDFLATNFLPHVRDLTT